MCPNGFCSTNEISLDTFYLLLISLKTFIQNKEENKSNFAMMTKDASDHGDNHY